MELVTCPKCQLSLWDPVTAACGHTLCRGCLLGGQCHVCQCRLPGLQDLRSNTLLAGLIDKCLDTPTKVRRVTRDLCSMMADRRYVEAGKLATKAIAMAPQDVPLRVLRYEVYVHLQQFPESLQEAEAICDLQPQNPDGFYRMGMAFLHMKRKEEALLQFQHCLTLNPQFSDTQQKIEERQRRHMWASSMTSSGKSHIVSESREQGADEQRGRGVQRDPLLKDSGHPTPSSLEELLGEVSQYLKLSIVDTTALISPLQASNTDVKLHEHQAVTFVEHSGDRTSQAIFLNRQQRKRMEPEEPAQAEKGLLNTPEEDYKQKIKLSSSGSDLLSLSDLECSLCIRMFLDPVTTPCGHTFCKECLLRSMDHRPYCPLCKQSLQEYLRVARYAVTGILVDLMAAMFPSEMTERKQIHLSEIAELSNLVSNVPIFVCTVAFPGVPCPLHVFEPRYRLMMRRCLETGTKVFGMCLYESGKSFADYGCMLEIQNLDYLPDGRSLVETVGGRRFRVLQRGQLDGYHKAEIEYLADKKVDGEELQEVQRLHDIVYQQLEQCFLQPGGNLTRRILMHHSGPPLKEDNIQASPDGPFWCWWLLSILPLDPNYQTLILSMTSLKERLFHLKHIFSVFLQSHS